MTDLATNHQLEALRHELKNLEYRIKYARLENGQALSALLIGDDVAAKKHTQKAQDFLNGRCEKTA